MSLMAAFTPKLLSAVSSRSRLKRTSSVASVWFLFPARKKVTGGSWYWEWSAVSFSIAVVIAAVSAATASLAAFLEGFGSLTISLETVSATGTPQRSAASSTDSGCTSFVSAPALLFARDLAGVTGSGSTGVSRFTSESTGMSMNFFCATGFSAAFFRLLPGSSGTGCSGSASASSSSGMISSSGMYFDSARSWNQPMIFATVKFRLHIRTYRNASSTTGTEAYTLSAAFNRIPSPPESTPPQVSALPPEYSSEITAPKSAVVNAERHKIRCSSVPNRSGSSRIDTMRSTIRLRFLPTSVHARSSSANGNSQKP